MNFILNNENVSDLSHEEFNEFLNIMVEDISKDIDCSTDAAIGIVAQYYNIDVEKVRSALKEIDSPFVGNNNIVWFQNGNKPLKRTNAWAITIRALTKIGNNFKRNANYNAEEIMTTLKEICGKQYVVI